MNGESLINAIITKIQRLDFDIDVNPCSYIIQHLSMINILTQGPAENINIFENGSFEFSFVSNLVASEIGCEIPQGITLLGPLR